MRVTKKQDAEMVRLRSTAQVFTKTNRILTGDLKVEVKLVEQGGTTPGWSSYPDVFINKDAFDDFRSTRTLVALLGLNYHELSHLMFTPRRSMFSVSPGSFEAFNILEDQRIESFFTARYQPAGKYFTEMVVRFLVEKEETWASAFVFTYGRSFLPLEIREEFEAQFALPEHLDEIKELITKYKTFRQYHFVSRQKMVMSVIQRFQDILNEVKRATQQSSLDTDQCQGATQQEGGQPNEVAEKEAQEKDRKRREKEERTGEDQSGFWEEDDDEESEDDTGDDVGESGGSEDSDEESEESESDDGDGGDTDGESDDDSDSADSGDDAGSDDGDSEGDEGTGGDDGDSDSDSGSPDPVDSDDDPQPGESDSTFESEADLEDYLEEILDAINEDESVQNEVSTIQAAINDNSPDVELIDFGKEPYVEVTPNPVATATLNKITSEFRRLYAEVEPGWRYGSDVGRLNIDRAMHDPENYEEMFDEWDEGREHDVGLEVVISCDLSGSMDMATGGLKRKAIDAACEALWIIKRSLDDVDAKVTVLGFHADTVGLFTRNDKADRTFWPRWLHLGGDTQPAHSMKLARRILARSPMPNKLFVIITDGGVGALDTSSDEYGVCDLEELTTSIPGFRMYVGLGGAENAVISRHCDVSASITDPSSLVTLTKNVVTKMLIERRRRG